jgi:hypothetical protein
MGLRLSHYTAGTVMPKYSVGWSCNSKEEAERNAKATGILGLTSAAEFKARYNTHIRGVPGGPLERGAWLYTWEEENEFGPVSP